MELEKITSSALKNELATDSELLRNEGLRPLNEFELLIAQELLDILETCEIEGVPMIPDLGSTTNASAKKKLLELQKGFSGSLWPIYLQAIELDMSDETLEIAHWVNYIHAWGWVVNNLHPLAQIQRDSPSRDVILEQLYCIATELFGRTVESEGGSLLALRNPNRFQSVIDGSGEYAETHQRRSGKRFVNSGRKVNMPELLEIIRATKQDYLKVDTKEHSQPTQ